MDSDREAPHTHKIDDGGADTVVCSACGSIVPVMNVELHSFRCAGRQALPPDEPAPHVGSAVAEPSPPSPGVPPVQPDGGADATSGGDWELVEHPPMYGLVYDVRMYVLQFLDSQSILALRLTSRLWAMLDEDMWTAIANRVRREKIDALEARIKKGLIGGAKVGGGIVATAGTLAACVATCAYLGEVGINAAAVVGVKVLPKTVGVATDGVDSIKSALHTSGVDVERTIQSERGQFEFDYIPEANFGTEVVVLVQRERYWPLKGWRPEMLPLDPPAWVCTQCPLSANIDGPDDVGLPDSTWHWKDHWRVVDSARGADDVGDEGWSYAFAFNHPGLFHAQCEKTDFVRQRVWHRTMSNERPSSLE